MKRISNFIYTSENVILLYVLIFICCAFLISRDVRFNRKINWLEDKIDLILDIETRKANFIRVYIDRVKEMKISERDAYTILSCVYDYGVERYNLSGSLVLAVIEQESNFRKGVTSSADAMGLMQIIPSTGIFIAGSLNRSFYDLYSIEDNIEFGCYYLSTLIDEYGESKALAFYNGGSKWKQCMEYTMSVKSKKRNWEQYNN